MNETAVRMMQMDDPIGKRFGYRNREGVIIGVVKDFHFVPMHQWIKPLAYILIKKWLQSFAYRVELSV